MRIAFVGNIANYSYRVVKALRAQTELDVHLYLDNKTPLPSLPESDDPELRDHYPDWIHKSDLFARRRLYPMLFPWTAPVVRELKTFDLLIVCHDGPMVAQFTGKPYCFMVMGADATIRPFPFRFNFWTKPKFHNVLAGIVLSYWQRRGIRQAAEVWVAPFKPQRDPLYEIGVKPERIKATYFPVIMDMARFSPDPNIRSSADPNIRQIVDNYDFVLFYPARLMLDVDPRLKAAGQWKANDILIKGFAEFIRRSGAERAVMVLPDVTMSRDIPLAKALIHDLDIEDHVFWAKAPRPAAFTRDEMAAYYSLADVVADDFGVGWFGLIVLEGLAFARPMINYIDETVMKQLYPWHPILSANTPEGVADHLMLLYTNPERKREIGLRSRQWVETFHAPDKASQVYVDNITEVVRRYGQSSVGQR